MLSRPQDTEKIYARTGGAAKAWHATHPIFLKAFGYRLRIAAGDGSNRNRVPMSLQRYFATCARGIEPILADELRTLGASAVEPGRGGVHFAGDQALLYRANLWL